MNLSFCRSGQFSRSLRFGLFLVLLALSGSLRATLVVEKPGNPDRYSTEDELGEFAYFDLSEAIRIQVIHAFINGVDGSTATFSIEGPFFQPEVAFLSFSQSLSLHPVQKASAKWQGISGLRWDVPAGTYKITIEGGDLPYAYGAPPSSINNSPYDFHVLEYDGGIRQAGGPFGLRIYGTRLSAVPEPSIYGLAGGTALLGAGIIRSRRRIRNLFIS